MTSLLRPDLIKDEARDEAYEYFDKHIRKLHWQWTSSQSTLKLLG